MITSNERLDLFSAPQKAPNASGHAQMQNVGSEGSEIHVKASWLGLIDYLQGESQQNSFFQNVTENKNQCHLMGCEFQPVITLGKRLSAKQNSSNASGLGPSEPAIAESRAIPVVQTDRGGLVTLHSPGQLVIYPVLSLRRLNWGVRDYQNALLSITQKTFRDFGIESEFGHQPGLFVSGEKIAFIGFRVQGGITRHGLSINLQNDLRFFDSIVPCGVPGARMTSAQLLLQKSEKPGAIPTPKLFFERWVTHFFGATPVGHHFGLV